MLESLRYPRIGGLLAFTALSWSLYAGSAAAQDAPPSMAPPPAVEPPPSPSAVSPSQPEPPPAVAPEVPPNTHASAELEDAGIQMEIYGHAMTDMGYEFGPSDPAWFDVLR